MLSLSLRSISVAWASTPGGLRPEGGAVQERGHGRHVGAEAVLRAEEVAAVLRAHGGVDVGQGGRGHPDVGRLVAEERGREAHDVQADAAADADDGLGAAVDVELLHLLAHLQGPLPPVPSAYSETLASAGANFRLNQNQKIRSREIARGDIK